MFYVLMQSVVFEVTFDVKLTILAFFSHGTNFLAIIKNNSMAHK